MDTTGAPHHVKFQSHMHAGRRRSRTGSAYGYVGSSNTGGLTPTEFSLGPTEYHVLSVAVIITDGTLVLGVRKGETDQGSLFPAEVDALRFHVCDDDYNVSAASYSGQVLSRTLIDH